MDGNTVLDGDIFKLCEETSTINLVVTYWVSGAVLKLHVDLFSLSSKP